MTTKEKNGPQGGGRSRQESSCELSSQSDFDGIAILV